MQDPVFSSPLRGEDTGEGERRNYPLSLTLSHKGRENLVAKITNGHSISCWSVTINVPCSGCCSNAPQPVREQEPSTPEEFHQRYRMTIDADLWALVGSQPATPVEEDKTLIREQIRHRLSA